jgi:hypothetical protein
MPEYLRDRIHERRGTVEHPDQSRRDVLGA